MSSLLELLLLWLAVDVCFNNNCAALILRPMSSSEDYINFRFKQTTDQVLLHSQKQYAKVEDGKWKNLWSDEQREQQQQPPRAINLFDEAFIIDERQVLSAALNLDEANDKKLQLNLASTNQPIKFIKSYFRRSDKSSFVVVCQLTCCTHYQALNDLNSQNFRHRQLICHAGLTPVDAAFFNHDNQVHLVVAYDSKDQPASSKIYRWNGTHMEYLDQLLVSHPKSVVTFQNDRSTTFILFTVDQRTNGLASDNDAAVYQLNHENLVSRVSRSSANAVVDAAPAMSLIYPYNYANQQFFLALGDVGSAEILRWNGAAFEKLTDLPDIIRPIADQIRLIQIDDNRALLFVSDANALRVYEIDDEKARHLAELALLDGQRVIDITAWKYEDAIMLLLVKINANATFQTQLWQLNLGVEQTDVVTEDYADVWACLRELKRTLDSRAAAVKQFQIAESRRRRLFDNYSSNSNETLNLSDLEIKDGNVSVVEFGKSLDSSMLTSDRSKLRELRLKASALTTSDELKMTRGRFSGEVRVDGEAFIEELHIDNLEASYVNGRLADFDNYLVSGIDQQFSRALSVDKVSVDELYVDKLCGYGSDHWMQANDSARSSIGNLKDIDGSSIINDTIVIESSSSSGLIMKELNARRINGIDWTDFLENSFVIGKEQTISGAVRYEGIVRATRLYGRRVNNVSSSDLITKTTNQSLAEVFIETLEVDRLHVQRINGVPIDSAARMSRENVIKGKVTLGKLFITDELTADESIAIPLTHSTQVYDQVYIDGNVFLKNLELEEPSLLILGGAGEALRAGSVRDLAANHWTKSGDQMIDAPKIRLLKGASVDRLDCSYLNGLAEHDFLYADAHQLSDLQNVTFANFQLNKLAEDFVEESQDSLTFRQGVRLRHLTVDNLFADKFNGIPIDSIMRSNNRSIELPDDFEFETVRVDAGMNVDELRVTRLNSRTVFDLGGALRTDRPIMELERLKGDEVHFASQLSVDKLNGRDLERALIEQEELLLSSGMSSRLSVDGAVTIEDGLRADRINDEDASDYVVSHLKDAADPSSLMQTGNGLVNLTVVGDLEVGLLNGRKLDDEFFAGVLSKTKHQTIDGDRVSLVDAQIKYLTADAINDVKLADLMYIDRPLVLQADNVSFARLRVVDGHLTCRTLNGQDASKPERKLRRLPINGLDNLLVQADVTWHESSSSNLRSLAHLLDNAVTKHDDQLIASPITFAKPVVVESLQLSRQSASSEISQRIREIISDTVVDDKNEANPIVVRGTKIFQRDLIVGDLEVDGNIDIERVNGLDIRDVSSRIFQKDKVDELVTADVTFLDNVQVGRLLTNANIHGVGLRQLAFVGQKITGKLQFQRLHVDGNVSLHKLDGLDFNDFIERRVTVDEDNEIFVDAEFVKSVRVSNETVVASLNDVVPEHLVQSNGNGLPIMLQGNKIFRSKLIVEQSVETSLINGFNVNSIRDDAVLNGTNANILRSLVFESEVEMCGNISVSGQINGFGMETKYLQNLLLPSSLSAETLSLLSSSFSNFDRQSRAFAASVLYLEEERQLNWHFAGVQSIKSPANVENKTRLEIVTAEQPELCGLRDDCLCRKQYVVDILPSGESEIHEQHVNNVSNSFYPTEGPYGLKIISTSASYSEQCSRQFSNEHSQIFWVRFDEHQEILRRTPALLINGYVSDAQIFQVQDQLYLIVAIFYDKHTNTHATDSLLYQFDLANGKTHLVQRIPTDGAKSIDVFQIPNVGVHLLIGCLKGRAESLLLRFNLIARQFQMIRTFATGGSKHVASLGVGEKSFVILSNPDVRALQIFNYDNHRDNFVDYQILFFEFRITSLGVFYGADFQQGDAFVATTTKDGWLYIYEYMFYGKFQRKMSFWADDIQVLTPFRHMSENYLFAGFKFNSTVYKVIQQGY